MLMFPNSKRGKSAALTCSAHRNTTSRGNRRLAPWPNAAIMDEEFEFHFNNYDESNVNRPRAESPDGDNAMCERVDGRHICNEDAARRQSVSETISSSPPPPCSGSLSRSETITPLALEGAGSAQFKRIRISRTWACLANNMLE
jgi:hypothetical protein